MAARLHCELGCRWARRQPCCTRLFGISITCGGVAQALARLGERCEPTYGALMSCVRRSLVAVMDETGWRVGGIRAWLWVAAGELVTDFQAELDKLEQQLRALLARPVRGADNPQGRLLRHLGRQFDALFTFLRLPGAPATNWMADQALRPAVVNRRRVGLPDASRRS